MDEERRNPEDLDAALHQMAAVVLGEETVDAIMHLLVSLAAASITDTAGASVSVVRTSGFETSNASSEVVRDIDVRQYDTGQGPCVAAMREGVRYNISLRAERQRWPEFCAIAEAQGMRSMLSTPLSVRDRTVGALNLYSLVDGGYGTERVKAAQTFADHASVVLANAMAYTTSELANSQLQEALASRTVIGQAQGLIMAARACTPEEAFDVLREASQRSHRKLRDVAQHVVDSRGQLPADATG